jgi:D-alanyl-D-alanine carboxypeptidase
MSRSYSFLSLCGVVLFTAARLAAQLPVATAAKIDEIATKTLTESGAPSLSIAVVQGGRVAYAKAYGTARLDPATDAKPE